jgi:hypothetical protein
MEHKLIMGIKIVQDGHYPTEAQDKFAVIVNLCIWAVAIFVFLAVII